MIFKIFVSEALLVSTPYNLFRWSHSLYPEAENSVFLWIVGNPVRLHGVIEKTTILKRIMSRDVHRSNRQTLYEVIHYPFGLT